MRQIAGTQSAAARTAYQSRNAAWGRTEIPAVLAGVVIAATVATPPKPRATATGEKATRAPKTAVLHRCRCSELVAADGEWSGCEKMVKGTFAPGHDAKAASFLVRLAQAGEEVYDEASQVWRNPAEVFEGTKLGQKIAAKLGQAEAVAKQAREVFADKTGASEAAETEATEAEKAAKPGKTPLVQQHRRQGAYAGKTTETSEVADLAWDEVVHPADREPALA